MDGSHIQFPISAKFAIGFTGLFHTAVAALAIGFAAIVTISQIVAYVKKDQRYDLTAKRVQLYHVCIYNIGTIVAIGLVFALSGLYPQFWSQLFVHQFWTLLIEEFLFFLLATTLTFHYFFWDRLWGHKKMHIFLGFLMNPLFLLQFYMINGIGSFMLTPGFQEGQATLSEGILGYDKLGFYNPSFLMLTFHRALANISYGGFVVAGLCGVMLYLAKKDRISSYWEDSGRLAYYVAFIVFLGLPAVGYFYAHVLKYHANEAYTNLMWGRGDVVAGGVDWWWVKQMCVAGMFGMSLSYFHRGRGNGSSFSLPRTLIYGLCVFFFMFYVGMGMIMTWKFFWLMLALAVGGWMLSGHLLTYHEESPRAVFLIVGILSFVTVMLGGYVREASRPRFVDRVAAYDKVYVPEERAPYLMVDVDPEEIPQAPPKPEPPPEPVRLIRTRCIGCHTLERVKNYPLDDWHLIVGQMKAYGAKLTPQEEKLVVDYLESGKPY